jgi:hypothetical protein
MVRSLPLYQHCYVTVEPAYLKSWGRSDLPLLVGQDRGVPIGGSGLVNASGFSFLRPGPSKHSSCAVRAEIRQQQKDSILLQHVRT